MSVSGRTDKALRVRGLGGGRTYKRVQNEPFGFSVMSQFFKNHTCLMAEASRALRFCAEGRGVWGLTEVVTGTCSRLNPSARDSE